MSDQRLQLRKFFSAVVVLASLFLAACSSNDAEEELGPAPLVEFEPSKVFDKVWSTSVGDGQGGIYNRLHPAIAQNVVYMASADGDVVALTADEGDEIWEVGLELPISGGVAVNEGMVLLGTSTGQVIALDRQSGETLWQTEVEGEVLAAPKSDGELVFVQTFDGQLLGLDAKSGERVWSFRTTLPVLTLRGTSEPLLARNMVIAGFANGKVMAFDTDTGAVRWDVRVATAKGNSEIERLVDIDGRLLLVDNIVYAVSYQGAIAAIDINSGRKLWTRDASSYVGMDTGFGNIYVSGQLGNVTAFVKNGQGVRWEQTVLERRKLTAPAVLGSYVLVGDFEGYLHALSQVDGNMSARTRVDSDGIQAPMLVSNDILYVYGNSGTLVAYQLKDKRSGFFSN